MRAVIYARYSTENQREASIEDQLEVCRRLIAREGWSLLRTYTDAAISGASRLRSWSNRSRKRCRCRLPPWKTHPVASGTRTTPAFLAYLRHLLAPQVRQASS